ncbi:hypothetical protein ACVRZD_09740 [Streptococcus hongkongensis]|nr:hypothetical protein NC01_08465 [Streptococcus uberis]
MQNKIDIARRLVMYHLISDMKITLDEVEQLVYELEESGLIQFDQDGRVKILDLEEDHETHYS